MTTAPSGGVPGRPIAILSAMHEELHALLPALRGAHTTRIAGREFHAGTVHGQPVLLVLAGMGKVAAATTAALAVQAFGARELLFTGVAGGLGTGVKVGDVVVARRLLQHDLDASPLFPRFEVPGRGRAFFEADPGLADALAAAARRCLARAGQLIAPGPLAAFGIDRASLHEGLVLSGDQFIGSASQSARLRALLPEALAVEMEGAAVAQVCADFGRPFAVLRTVSDRADDNAHVDFKRFIDEVASVYTCAIVEDWLRHVPRGEPRGRRGGAPDSGGSHACLATTA